MKVLLYIIVSLSFHFCKAQKTKQVKQTNLLAMKLINPKLMNIKPATGKPLNATSKPGMNKNNKKNVKNTQKPFHIETPTPISVKKETRKKNEIKGNVNIQHRTLKDKKDLRKLSNKSEVKLVVKTKKIPHQNKISITNPATSQKVKKPMRIDADTFKMIFPVKEYSIKHPFGRIKIRSTSYNNESITFKTNVQSPVYCNVDSGVVQSIDFSEEVYTVFIKKDHYTIVLYNIAVLYDIKVGQVLNKYDLLGLIAIDEMNENEGELELMLFKNSKIVNPIKYLIKADNNYKNELITNTK